MQESDRNATEVATGPAADGGPGSGARLADAGSALRTLPVVEERLEVGKRVVERGGWRLTKQVETVEETVDELLTSRRVEIERRPVGTLLEGLEPPATRREGDTLVFPVVREVLVTEKRLLLVEEVRIREVETSHREPQQVTLRKEHLVVERLDADPSA